MVPSGNKIVSREQMAQESRRLRQEGKILVFTNGCFDLIHAGHVRYLSAAKAEGDVLVVGLNSDASVTAIKGPARPVNSQDQRAEVLAALACVDHVVIFDEPDPYGLIAALMPQVLVKGADWAEGQIIGADIVAANGGKVVRIPFTCMVSTSAIIAKIIQLAGNRPTVEARGREARVKEAGAKDRKPSGGHG
jgi:rfaE bifunctional protein nucleotidyltransferase chain/domain